MHQSFVNETTITNPQERARDKEYARVLLRHCSHNAGLIAMICFKINQSPCYFKLGCKALLTNNWCITKKPVELTG